MTNLHEKVIEFLRDSGISAAALLREIEGYETDRKIHTIKILELSYDLPVVVKRLKKK
jgi:PII-like signaling protein